MGGFAFYGSFDDDTPKSLFEMSTEPRFTVDVPEFDTLLYIMEHFPNIITDVTEEDILDRTESSSMSKALLIIQVAWFCTNCAARLSQGLTLSLLEVSTAARALCTLLSYIVWWSKPINVPAPTLLKEKEAREVYALLKCSCGEYDRALDLARQRAAGDSSIPTGPHISEKIALAADALQHLVPTSENPRRLLYSTPEKLPQGCLRFRQSQYIYMPIPGGGITKIFKGGSYASITIAIPPILYGIVHLLAWSVQFPTTLDQLLWRVSSVVITCSGLVIFFVVSFLGWSGRFPEPLVRRLSNLSMMVLANAHMFASSFLIIESIRQLFYLDGAAYQITSWSNYWPHLS